MSERDSRIETLVIALAGAALFSVSRSIFGKARDAYKDVIVLGTEMTKVRKAAERVADELAYMRSVTQGAVEAAAAGEGQDPYAPPAPPSAPKIPPFPTRPMSAYTVVPDAVPGDTDMESLTQTDEDMAELEKLDKLRAAGYITRDEEEPPAGVAVEST